MCQRKWRTHTTTFKNIKDKHNQTGRGRDSWEYYEAMEDIFAKDPSYEPLATISCGIKPTQIKVANQNIDLTLNSLVKDKPEKSSSPPPRKKQKKKKLQTY